MRQFRITLPLFYAIYTGIVNAASLPSGFVYLHDVVPAITLDIRYANTNNFVGTPIDGYVRSVAITTSETAKALNNAQADLQRFGLSLKVFDAYRPQRSVDHFVRWAKDFHDLRMQAEYYPHIAKQNLFREGYIASKSGHSRGSTVDVTLIYADANGLAQELDRGRERLSPSPPSEPGVQFSRDGLSSQLFPHRDWRANLWASDIVNSSRSAKKAFTSFNPCL